MSQPHQGFQDAVTLLNEQTTSLQREFGHVISGKNYIVNQINYPQNPNETAEIRSGVKHLIEGSLLLYLFWS